MAIPSIPARGSTDWYAYAQGLDTAARAISTVRVDGSPVDTFDVDSTPVTAADLGAMTLQEDGYGDILDSGESILPRRKVNTAGVGLSASGTMRFTYFRARKTGTVTSLRLQGGTTAAATVTLIRLGLYAEDVAGNLTLVGATANDTTLFSVANTLDVTKALTTPWTGKTAGSRYALGVLVVATTTPTFAGIAGTPSGGLAAVEMFRGPKVCANLTGQTDLPSSIPVGSLTSTGGGLIYAALVP